MRRTRRGQGLVEFALIAPLFFVMLFGIIEGGRLLWTYHTVSNAAKEGSRYTMVRGDNSELSDAPATGATIKSHIMDKTTGLAAEDTTVTLDLLDGDKDNKSRFQVTVAYEHEFVVGPLLGLNDMRLTADSTAIFSR